MSKYEDTRIVTFKEDYSVTNTETKEVRVYYKKGSKHAIHWKVVEKLKEKGAKMDVTKFDRKAYVEREKEKVQKKKDHMITVERR